MEVLWDWKTRAERAAAHDVAAGTEFRPIAASEVRQEFSVAESWRLRPYPRIGIFAVEPLLKYLRVVIGYALMQQLFGAKTSWRSISGRTTVVVFLTSKLRSY